MLHHHAAWSRYRLHILLWHSGSRAGPAACRDTRQEALLPTSFREAAAEVLPRERSQQRAPAAQSWHVQFSPHVPSSMAPSFNFEVSHHVQELRYDTRAQAVHPDLGNRRTDFGSPRQFTKTKAGLQRIAAGYRATQTVEEQSEQLCFPTLQTWRVIKPGRHWFSNTLAH